ncbi:type II secretion system F family protein [Psychromicrobium lacuslunae]|uniref:Type II secretion system protein F n=1 Tax=Psychromicrobium lacuslunae TaxID=1618207 RepID=A0A0D4BYK1_9MICC|nr:type II secretion system F family protein [Psychromicrobium lacuslunae]AJT41404.1 type II secretion system protein F [Psychromicrobium lacuslunae]
MSILAGLLLGAGFFLIWCSFWPSHIAFVQAPQFRRINQLLIQAGLQKTTAFRFFASCLLAGFSAFLIVILITRSPPMSVCFAGLAAWLPIALVRRRARRRSKALRELWPEVVDNLRSAVRAGLSISEALAQLADRGPAELRSYFADFSADYRLGGRFDQALERLKAQLADPVADRIIEALKLARDVGGTDLGGLLFILSSFLRENIRIRAELEAKQSWLINAAKLAVLAPWLLLLVLASHPQTIQAYNSVTGWLVLLIGLLISIICYRVMLRIGALPEELRALA